jgi:hypothetical protein
MGFPQAVAEKVLVDCGRCCAICHKFCGTKIELHHIKQAADSGADTYENCIPLCFDCHAEVKAYNPKHPKGKKYTESELVAHRDKWYEKQQFSIATIPINDKKVASDISVLTEVKTILSDKNVPFLFHYDYYVEFDRKTIESLEVYVDKCYNPEFEFFDADMEAHKARLLERIKELLWLIDGHTSYFNGKYTVGGDIKDSEPIHQEILMIKAIFDDLVKLSRRKY